MHAAPPVRIEVGPDRVWTVLSVLLGALSGLSLCWWALDLAGMAPAEAAMATVLGALGCAAFARRMLALGQGELTWDGVRWSWEGLGGGGTVEVRPIVAFDVGPWLLLHLVAAHATTWVSVSRGSAGNAWTPWRAALYSQTVASPPDGAPRT